MPYRPLKLISLCLCFILCLQQSGLAQALIELNLASYLATRAPAPTPDKFRPLHLRYLDYDNLNNSFKLLLDKGDLKEPKTEELEAQTKTLLEYFFIGITLPNESFWVNLRPDSPDNIIDDYLAQTDIGKILLEADVQLKKDTALATSPATPEGKKYWDRLYKKAGELFSAQEITIPTLVRPWIVPNEIILRETDTNAYIYKATLKVMLEEDYLTVSGSRLTVNETYSFKDPRLKALNKYSAQLLRELIIPKLTKEVNSSKRYAPLRQVYYSLILAQWFKQKFYGKGGLYSWLIDKKDLTNLTSQDNWSKTTYFKAYQASFKNGEYNLKEPMQSPFGQSIRSYFSGGISWQGLSATFANIRGNERGAVRLDLLLPGLAGYIVPATAQRQDLASPLQVAASPVVSQSGITRRGLLGGAAAAAGLAILDPVPDLVAETKRATAKGAAVQVSRQVNAANIKHKKMAIQIPIDLDYPVAAHQIIVREISRLYRDIEMAFGQRENISNEPIIIRTPDGQPNLRFLESLIQIMREQGYMNLQQPKELAKILVNGFGINVFKLLEQSNISQDIKRFLNEGLISCAVVSEEGRIVLRSYGFEHLYSATAYTLRDQHALIVTPINKDEDLYMFIDFAQGIIGEVNLSEYYTQEGVTKVLKLKYRRLLSKRLADFLKNTNRGVINLNKLTNEDKVALLNYYYPSFQISDTDKYGFTANRYYNRATVMADVGQLEQAVRDYWSAIKYNPQYAPAYMNLGTSLVELGKLKQPKSSNLLNMAELSRLLSEAELSILLNETELERCFRENELIEFLKLAAIAYKRSINRNPNLAMAHYNLGNIIFNLCRQSGYREAMIEYHKAVDINPDYAEAHLDLGVIYFNLGNDNEAIRHWLEVVRLKRWDLLRFLPNEALELLPEEVKKAVKIGPSASGSSPVDSQKGNISTPLGGIDFSSLPIITHPTLNLSPNLNNQVLPNLNLDEYWFKLQRMIKAHILPSVESFKEYVHVCMVRKDIALHLDRLFGGIADILRLEEEINLPTEPSLIDILTLLENNQTEPVGGD